MEINPLYSRYVEENEELYVEEFNESHTRCQRSSHSPESMYQKYTNCNFFIILVHVHYESSMMLLAGQGRRKV